MWCYAKVYKDAQQLNFIVLIFEEEKISIFLS